MTDNVKIKELFASDINRQIEEVIKVDQTDSEIIRDEIDEYVVTETIRGHYARIFDRYWETKNKPHEGIGIWVSGFFGSGKSSFAKMLGLAIENREVQGEEVAKLFGQRTGDQTIKVLLDQISEHIPTDAVIFDVSTDRGIKSGSQTLTEIMYRLFLQSLGYAGDLDLAELEITLEQKGQLEDFQQAYQDLFSQEWDENKDLISFSLGEASAVMHSMFPERYSSEDAWIQAVQDRADITPGKLAERCEKLMTRRRPDRNLVFVIDEVGQFVARDVQKMLDLQAVVQSLGRVGRGKVWIVVTSQEKLTELVGGMEDHRVELARLMDRFPLQVHLEPSDISEVTSKRVLAKTAEAEKVLRELFKTSSGRLSSNTRLSADIQLPDLTAERFMDLYPLLPYQIDLIIQVVSGLRMQGGASKHVGGANRTIIKLAQQLLIHDAVDLADQPVGALARIDQIYDLVAGNIDSEIRGKIASIKDEIAHPMAQPAAKAICLLQYVQSIHRTAENIAAALHPQVDADSVLPDVKNALSQLAAAHKVRLSDGQYRIPTPAEDDWETTRAGFRPKPPDVNRIHSRVMASLWEPKPSHNLLDARVFKGGLVFHGRSLASEDVDFHITFADAGADYEQQVFDARARSQTEQQAIFWVVPLTDSIDRHTVEVARSEEMLSRKERSARTKVETSLVGEEKLRLRNHESELRRLVKEALLSGSVFFRGNDRSPQETTSVSQAASNILGKVLPDVFDRFQEAAAKVSPKDLEALMVSESLHGLPSVFDQLNLIRHENGQPFIEVESGPLREVLDQIENRTAYGETATGRYLEQTFGKEPYGWGLEAVQLFTISLLRAGRIKARNQGTIIESARSGEARKLLPNNTKFRATSFQKKDADRPNVEDLLQAEEAFKHVFGIQLPELQTNAVASAVRAEIAEAEEDLHQVHTLLVKHNLPGEEILKDAFDQMRVIGTAADGDAVLAFNASYKELGEAIKRAAELGNALDQAKLHDLQRAQKAIQSSWGFLQTEDELEPGLVSKAHTLMDLMSRETFYRNLPEIEQNTGAIEEEYGRRFDHAVEARAQAYESALEVLRSADSWVELNEEQQRRLEKPLRSRAERDVDSSTQIPLLRADTMACQQLLKAAIREASELAEGSRLVSVDVSEYFDGKIETPEQLDAAVEVFRRECLRLLAADKKLLVQ